MGVWVSGVLGRNTHPSCFPIRPPELISFRCDIINTIIWKDGEKWRNVVLFKSNQ